MTKTEALHSFFSSFGLPAFPSGEVVEDNDEKNKKASMPYLTYTKGVASSYECTVHLYYYTESELVPDKKAEEICERLRNGGEHVNYDGGTAWVTTSSPEWFSSPDDTDRNYKHRIINLSIDYLEIM